MERTHLKQSNMQKMVDVNYTCDDFRRNVASKHTVTVPKDMTLNTEATVAFYNQFFLSYSRNVEIRSLRTFRIDSVYKWRSLILTAKTIEKTQLRT